MALIKTLNLGQTKVEIYDDYVPTEVNEKKVNLKGVYDTINDIAWTLGAKKTKGWFPPEKVLETMEISENYNFM